MSSRKEDGSTTQGSSSKRIQRAGTVSKVAETMRSNIGLLRILFSQLGHKEMCPKRLVILAEIVDRWSFDDSESRVVDALLRKSRPVGGRDVVDYHTFVKLVRQPSGAVKRHGVPPGIAAAVANMPQPPARPGTSGTSRTTASRTSQGVNPSVANYLDEVDYSKELLTRNVSRELTDCLNAVARATATTNTQLLGEGGAHTFKHSAPGSLHHNQDHALTLAQFTKAVRGFDDRVSPLHAKTYFIAAAQKGGEVFKAGAGGTVKVSFLVEATIGHLPLTRHKVFSSEQVRETFAWPVSFLEEYGRPEWNEASPGVAAGSARAAVQHAGLNSAHRSTKTVELKKMLVEQAIANSKKQTQIEATTFSVWSPRRLGAEGRISPRVPKRPHHPAMPKSGNTSAVSSARSSHVA